MGFISKTPELKSTRHKLRLSQAGRPRLRCHSA